MSDTSTTVVSRSSLFGTTPQTTSKSITIPRESTLVFLKDKHTQQPNNDHVQHQEFFSSAAGNTCLSILLSMRTKTLCFVILLFAITTAIILAILLGALPSSFNQIEQELLADAGKRVTRFLSDELNILVTKSLDYAIWVRFFATIHSPRMLLISLLPTTYLTISPNFGQTIFIVITKCPSCVSILQ
jgi:hypothetical protein